MGTPGGSSSLVFLPDGRLVTAGRGGLTLWEVRTGEFRVLPLPGVWQRCVALSPTGTVWTGDDQGILREWDLAAGRVVRAWRGFCPGALVGLAIAPRGTRAYWLTGQSWYGMVDLATGESPGELRQPDRFGDSVALSTNGAWVAFVTNRAVELIDLIRGELRHRFEYGGGRSGPRSAAFSPDGSHLLIGTQTPPRLEHYRLPDLAPGPLHGRDVGQAGAYQMAFAPDGATLAIGQIADTTLLAYPGGEELQRLPQGDGGYVAGLAFSPDGGTVATYGAQGQLRFWDPARGETHLHHDAQACDVLDVAVDDELRMIATGDDHGRLRRWGLDDGRELHPPLALGTHPVCRVAFPADDALEAWTRSGPLGYQSWTLAPASAPGARKGALGREPDDLVPVASPDGALVLRASHEYRANVELFDVSADEPVRRWSPHRGDSPKPGTRLADFHPSGRYLATAGEDKVVRIHHGLTFEELLALEEPVALRGFFPRDIRWRARRLRFSPDGRLLALGGVDGSLILYELELVDERRPGERLRIERRVHVIAHTAPIHALAFGRSSSLLVTASADSSALAWDVDRLLSLDHRSLDMPPGEGWYSAPVPEGAP